MQGMTAVLKMMGIDPDIVHQAMQDFPALMKSVAEFSARFERMERDVAAIKKSLTKLDPNFVDPEFAQQAAQPAEIEHDSDAE